MSDEDRHTALRDAQRRFLADYERTLRGLMDDLGTTREGAERLLSERWNAGERDFTWQEAQTTARLLKRGNMLGPLPEAGQG
jgi:hypothetical protein